MDYIKTAAHAGTRSATCGAIATGLAATVGDTPLPTSFAYGVRIGVVNFASDAFCSQVMSMDTSESSDFTAIEYLCKVACGALTYAVAHHFLPDQFTYVRGSWKATAVLNATAIYLGNVAGDRIRAQVLPKIGMGDYV